MYEEDDHEPPGPRWVDIRKEASYSVGSRRDTFVAPARREIRVSGVETLSPEEHELQAPGAIQSQLMLQTNHFDRAKGFSLSTLPLAVAVGLGAALISVLFFELDLFSLAAVTVLFVAFMVTWLAAWVIYQLASPDGVSLFATWGHYRLLRYEQRARLRRMEHKE